MRWMFFLSVALVVLACAEPQSMSKASAPAAAPAKDAYYFQKERGPAPQGISGAFVQPEVLNLNQIVADDTQSAGAWTFSPAKTHKADLLFANNPAVAQASGQKPEPKADSNRKVIYSGSMALRVAQMKAAQESIRTIIEKYDGFILRATLDSVTFRVKPEDFDTTMKELEALGEVASREMHTDDVTAQYFDLQLRIEVAESSRKRVMALLEKAGSLKDVLEAERDVRRLTEEIEQMKGQLRLLTDKIDLATITVQLQEKAQQANMVKTPRQRAGGPFAWFDLVGIEQTMQGAPPDAPIDGGGFLGHLPWRPRFELGGKNEANLPDNFAPAMSTRHSLLGATPEDYRLRANMFDLRQSNGLDFWAKALETDLRERRGYEVKTAEETTLKQKDLAAKVIHCTTTFAGETWAYDVWLVHKKGKEKRILVIEFAREAKDAQTYAASIESAIEGVQLKGLVL